MIQRIPFLPRADFIRDYLTVKRPVILTGLTAAWPAMQLWTPDYLKHRVGDATVEVMAGRDADANYEVNCNQHRQHLPFAAFVDHVFGGSGNDSYLVANNAFMSTPGGRALVSDVPPFPEYLLPDTNGRVHFWFGPAGTVTPLHYDTCDILLCQVIGSKRVRMINPTQQGLLYNRVGVFSDVDYERPDLARFPLFGQVVADEFVLCAGDVLFIPFGHWHHVRSLSASASVSFTNFIR